tara:strand:+ start:829 stop:1293 length:465 start_codon:yes stop_codon:yes gene_type:complete
MSILYLSVVAGLIYLSYNYVKYINKLEKDNCKCSEDMKRDMVKNFSYLILLSWVILFFVILFVPPKTLNILNNKYVSLFNYLFVVSYGFLLFFYSKKLIDESCECSESWVRDAMQYQSYVYISLSVISILLFLTKLLIGNDKREVFKLINALRN